VLFVAKVREFLALKKAIVIEPSDIFQHPTVTHSLSLILGVGASFFLSRWLNHKYNKALQIITRENQISTNITMITHI